MNSFSKQHTKKLGHTGKIQISLNSCGVVRFKIRNTKAILENINSAFAANNSVFVKIISMHILDDLIDNLGGALR